MRAILTFVAAVVFVLKITSAVTLDEGPTDQIVKLESLVGETLLVLKKLIDELKGALAAGQFNGSSSIAETAAGTVQGLQLISNITETLLQHSQYERYRTITSSLRIIHNTCARLAIELEKLIPIVEAGKFSDESLVTAANINQQMDVGHNLLKRYLQMLIETS
ncbi:uncharacterized protein LOC131685618 [Topomyia yanbarensis]|uniref:uncharacterized protein LOC131685618 n=1 Tax=Topomyia yanbarensis TaxID=2498891 RepID=UPI00273AB98F|nr:uncharacterized protein LOC131685618 [Topomyia yanbarensis]